MRKKTIIYLMTAVFLFFSISCLAAQEDFLPQTVFYRANMLFQEGKYVSAKDAYESILAKGYVSGNLYYNLGNTHFKLGKLGKTILNYERAKRFIPCDSDLRSNLDYAYSLMENLVESKKPIWIIRILLRITACLNLDTLCLLLSAAYFFLTIIFGLARILKHKHAAFKYAVIINLTFLIVFGSAWFIKFYETHIRQYAIVITTQTDCKFAPSDDAVTYFKLYEGAKVVILRDHPGWLRIKSADGKIGWIKNGFVEKIA